MDGYWEGELPDTTPPPTAASSTTHSRSSSQSRGGSHRNSGPSTPVASSQASRRFLDLCLRPGSVAELSSLLNVLPSEIKRSNARAALFNTISSGSVDAVETLLRDLVEDGYLKPAPNFIPRRQSSESIPLCPPPVQVTTSGGYSLTYSQFFDAPISSNGWSALMVACSLGYTQIAKTLMRAGASASAPVHLCPLNPVFAKHSTSTSRVGTPKVEGSPTPPGPPSPLALDAALPLKVPSMSPAASGVSSTAKCQAQCGLTPLHVAAHAGHVDCIGALVRAGAEVKCDTRDGTFPLLLAAQEGHADACRELLAQGADPNQARRDGVTALYKAVEKAHAETVDVLLAPIAGDCAPCAAKAGEDGERPPVQIVCTNLDPMSTDGLTPLFVAVLKRNHALAKRLLEAKARPEPPCERVTVMGGRVPLHYAAAAGDRELCELLIEHGAQVNSYDDKGVTPAAVARLKQHMEVHDWLVHLARVGNRGTRKQKRSSRSEAAEAEEAGSDAEAANEGDENEEERDGDGDGDGDNEAGASVGSMARPTSSMKRIKVVPRVHKRTVAIPAMASTTVWSLQREGSEGGASIDWAKDSDEAILAALDRAQADTE